MGKRHGRMTRAWIGGYRLSQDATQVDTNIAVDVSEVTTLEEDDKTHLVGQKGGTVPWQGFFNDDAERVDEQMATLFAALGTEEDILVLRGTTQGDAGFATSGSLAREYGIQGPNAGPVTVTSAFLTTGVNRRVQVVDGYGTVTSITDGTTAASLDTGQPQGSATFYIMCDFLNEGTLEVKPFHGVTNLVEGTVFGTAVFTSPGGTAYRIEGGVEQFFHSIGTLRAGGSAAFVTAVSVEAAPAP